MSRQELLKHLNCEKHGRRSIDTRLKELTQSGYLKKTYIEGAKVPEAFYELRKKSRTQIPTVQAEIYSQRAYEVVEKNVGEIGEHTLEEFSKVLSTKIGYIFTYALAKQMETRNPAYLAAIGSLAPKLIHVLKKELVYHNQPNLESSDEKETLKAFQNFEAQPKMFTSELCEVLEKLCPEVGDVYPNPRNSSLKPIHSKRIPLNVKTSFVRDYERGRPSRKDVELDKLLEEGKIEELERLVKDVVVIEENKDVEKIMPSELESSEKIQTESSEPPMFSGQPMPKRQKEEPHRKTTLKEMRKLAGKFEKKLRRQDRERAERRRSE